MTNDVHVWTFELKALEAAVLRIESVLSEDEIARAAGFRFKHLRDSFVLTRGVLRYVLGRYLDLSPAEIQIHYGSKGKPGLAENEQLQFNMSHSGNIALVALANDCLIGVDVEHVRALTDMQVIANRFFCPEEAEEIQSVHQFDRQRAFFRCWTRKEAYIKAIGDGLSVPLDSFRVSLQPGSQAHVALAGNNSGTIHDWTLRGLSLGEEYEGAVAYAGAERPLHILPVEDAASILEL